MGEELSLFGMEVAVYFFSCVEFQADSGSKNTTTMMLKRQLTMKANTYGNTAQF